MALSVAADTAPDKLTIPAEEQLESPVEMEAAPITATKPLAAEEASPSVVDAEPTT